MAAKYLKDFKVLSAERVAEGYALLKLRPDDGVMPEIYPGQFVNVHVKQAPHTLLRRPISVNFVDYTKCELWLLVKNAGEATCCLCNSQPGDTYSILLPLGKGFTVPDSCGAKVLLVGGGVGIAPLLYLGHILRSKGIMPQFLLGARSAGDLLEAGLMEQYGSVGCTTEDGSAGVKGLVTAHPALAERYDMVYCCGPMPMMKAVALAASAAGSPCEVSLENKMACGLGACLCCVEDTVRGHECTCTSGPVFNTNELKW